MDKTNFVKGFRPDKADFDLLQNSLENGLENVAAAIAGKGIKTGYTVTIAGSIASVSAGSGFDGLGRALIKDSVITVDLGTIQRPAAGLYRWVTLALKYKITEEGQVIDITNQTYPAQYLDDVEVVIVDSENDDTAANITKPALTDYQVPLLDIRVDETSAWENLVTENPRLIVLRSISDLSNDVVKTAHLPIGLVWMYDGENWVDNVTLPGWYACVAGNAAQGCPDMVDRFVMGKVVAGAGAQGGSNTHTLTVAELPVHTHTINHDHAAVTSGGDSVDHYHGYYKNAGIAIATGGGGSYPVSEAASTTGTQSAYHTHNVDIPNFTGSSGNGGFANDAIDMKPAYYSMIFIRKCA